MNLLQIRTKFRELSGRFDLVNDDFSDNGADFFINEGSKFLDRLDENQKSWASCFRFLEIGLFSVQFPYCRAIKEVWAGSTTGRWQVKKINLQDLLSEYLTGLPNSRSNGLPLYYSPCITRYIPENATVLDIESFIGWVEVPSGNHHEYNAILFNVPTSEKLTIDIRGLFYSQKLIEDIDKNYWSEVHPLLLISASMRQLEITNRNTQGVNDWTSAIQTEIQQIGFDLVEELISEVDQMEG
jgi:hypothetical protein